MSLATQVASLPHPPSAMNFNGVYLEDKVSGYYTESVEGRYNSSVDITTRDITGVDGSEFVRKRYETRELSVKYSIYADTKIELHEKESAVKRCVSDPEGKIIFDDEPQYYWIGTVSQVESEGIDATGSGIFVSNGTITIALDDPFKYSVVTKEFTATDSGKGYLELDVDNEGTAPVNIDYKITHSGHDNGYLGFASRDGSMEFGNMQEVDGVNYKANDTVLQFSDITNLKSDGSTPYWRNATERATNDEFTTSKLYQSNNTYLTIKRPIHDYTADNPGKANQWDGAFATVPFKADSAGKVGGNNFKCTFAPVFSSSGSGSSDWHEATSFYILGDSYSDYYDPNGSEFNTYDDVAFRNDNYRGYYPRGDVTSPTDMWYCQLGNDYYLYSGGNYSVSGSTVSNVNSNSFVQRVRQITNVPQYMGDREGEVYFIFGGTNDAWGHISLGNYVFSGWSQAQLKTFRPACAYIINAIKSRWPNCTVCWIINDIIDKSYKDSIKAICDHYSVPWVETSNIARSGNHPTKAGMASIGKQVANALNITPPRPAVGGLSLAFLTSDNKVVAALDIVKGSPYKTTYSITYSAYDGTASGQLFKSVYNDSSCWRGFPPSGNSIPNIVVKKEGRNISFAFPDSYKVFNTTKTISTDVAATKVQIAINHFGPYPVQNYIGIRGFTLEKLNVDHFRDTPNRYRKGSVVTIDGDTTTFYVDGVPQQTDELVGSKYFLAYPGSNQIRVLTSSFCKPAPTVVATIREKFI